MPQGRSRNGSVERLWIQAHTVQFIASLVLKINIIRQLFCCLAWLQKNATLSEVCMLVTGMIRVQKSFCCWKTWTNNSPWQLGSAVLFHEWARHLITARCICDGGTAYPGSQSYQHTLPSSSRSPLLLMSEPSPLPGVLQLKWPCSGLMGNGQPFTAINSEVIIWTQWSGCGTLPHLCKWVLQ